jgi:hypothetical protein
MFLRLYYQYSPSRLSTCPLTIHALLHVVDGMEAAGPVWTYWAFPTERFCGRLLPHIRSRRHPFSNIDNFVVASAKLSQIKIMYNLDEELSLRPKNAEALRGSFSHPSCTSLSSCSTQTPFLTAIGLLDPRYVLLPPQRPSSTILQPVENKIAIHFATRFSQNVNTVRRYLKRENITQWARVQRLAGGDLMYASELFFQAEDRRDATYVRVCIHLEASIFKLTRKFLLV